MALQRWWFGARTGHQSLNTDLPAIENFTCTNLCSGRRWWTTPLSLVIEQSPGKPLSPSAAKLRLLKKLRCTLRYEKRAWATGAQLVAGADEVGRGSLFGPVVAAAVILDPAYPIRGLRDSKHLPAGRREEVAIRIREHSICLAIAAVDSARIDQINIYQASRLAIL